MEDQLRFCFVLPLKEIVLRRVVICLWNETDAIPSNQMFNSMWLLHGQYVGMEFQIPATVESKVEDKVLKLKLPNSLEEQLLHVISPIGLQIKTWKDIHNQYLEMPSWKEILEKHSLDSCVKFDASIIKKLCWTTAGAVDYRKTAEELIRCEMVDIFRRYQLASLYCLDDRIPIFWEELPEEIKRKFYNGGKPLSLSPEPQFYWPFILRGELSKLDRITVKYHRAYTSFYHHAFHYSLSRGNKAAAQYFIQKLTQEEKEASLVGSTVGAVVQQRGYAPDCFSSGKLSDVLCYLLSQMNREQQMEAFKFKSTEVFLSFMVWPCQDIFLENARLLWSFFPTGEYEDLLQYMSYRYSHWEEHIYYVKSFQKFFIHSPVDFKKFFVDQQCVEAQFFEQFFEDQDLETIQVVFRNLDAADRLRLVFSDKMFRQFYHAIVKDKQDVVEVCFREATLSKEDRERLREAFMEFLTTLKQLIKDYRPIENQFLLLLDRIDASSRRKRCLEDETLDKARKLRSDE